MPEQPAETTQAGPEPDKTPPTRRKWPRRLAVTAVVLMVLLALLIGLLPTLLSTGPGNRLAARIATGQINGNVDIGNLSVGWTDGLKLDRVVVEDEAGVRVAEVAKLHTDLTVGALIGIAMGGDIDLGQTTLAANLPSVRVYPDGTTNLDRLVDSDEKPSDEPGPAIRGDVTIERLDATVQRVDEEGDPLRDVEGDAVPFAGVIVADATLTLTGDGIVNKLPIELTAMNRPAGKLLLEGDLTVEGDELTQTIVLDKLNLAALSLIAEAFGSEVPVRLAGTGDGTVQVDLADGTFDGAIDVAGLQVDPPEGKGYAAETLTLSLSGTAAEGDATTCVVAFEMPEGTGTFTATVDPAKLEAQDPTAVRDILVDVDLPYLRLQGGGVSVVGLDLSMEADATELQRIFGDLVKLEDARYAGRIEQGRLRTINRDGRLAVRLEGVAKDVFYEDTSPEAEPDAEPTEIAEATFAGYATLDPTDTTAFYDVGLRLSLPDVVDVTADAATVDEVGNVTDLRLIADSEAGKFERDDVHRCRRYAFRHFRRRDGHAQRRCRRPRRHRVRRRIRHARGAGRTVADGREAQPCARRRDRAVCQPDPDEPAVGDGLVERHADRRGDHRPGSTGAGFAAARFFH